MSVRFAAQKIKFSIRNFSSKCDQIRSFTWILLHLQKKFLVENFIFCAAINRRRARIYPLRFFLISTFLRPGAVFDVFPRHVFRTQPNIHDGAYIKIVNGFQKLSRVIIIAFIIAFKCYYNPIRNIRCTKNEVFY